MEITKFKGLTTGVCFTFILFKKKYLRGKTALRPEQPSPIHLNSSFH